MNNPVLLHINYFEPLEPLGTIDEACRSAAALGACGIEFRRTPPAGYATEEDYLDAIAKAVERSALRAISFGTPGVNLVAADPCRRRQALDEAASFYEKAARNLPLTTINLVTGSIMNSDPAIPGAAYARHGSAAATEEQWEFAVAGLKELARLGEALGLTFALETHPCYLHDTANTTRRLVEEAGDGRVGVLWDHTNLLLMSEEPPSLQEGYAALGSHLMAVHLKNFLTVPRNGEFVVSALADGIVNIREQISLLRTGGYMGPLCIESPRMGDRVWFAEKDLRYLQSLMRAEGSAPTV